MMWRKNSGARFAALRNVDDVVMTTVGSSSSCLYSRIGLGVVVMMPRGLVPTRKPSSSMSQAYDGSRHAHSSSAQKRSCCGPRRRSGLSAEKRVAMAPFGHDSCCRLGSYDGRDQGGHTASKPDDP